MANVVVVGAQWGDEGKGKTVLVAIGNSARRQDGCDRERSCSGPMGSC